MLDQTMQVHNRCRQAQIVRREYSEQAVITLIDQGMHPMAARVLAARIPVNPARTIGLTLNNIDPPDGLPDLDRAVQRIMRAINGGDIICTITKGDVAGVVGQAIILDALINHFGHPRDRTQSYIWHGENTVGQIKSALRIPSLAIITSCDVSDLQSFAPLCAMGMDIIILDRAMTTDTALSGVVACVSTARTDCVYPDRGIAGSLIAWLVLNATRERMLSTNRLPQNAPSLSRLLDLVAIGSVAEDVTLAGSVNNRIAIRYGSRLIDACIRPAWRQARDCLSKTYRIDASNMHSFMRRNFCANGSVENALRGIQFLLARNTVKASTVEPTLDCRLGSVGETENTVEPEPEAVIYSDGDIPSRFLGLGLVAALSELEPYGLSFPPAVFESRFRVESACRRGQENEHLHLSLSHPKGAVEGIWYYAANTRIMNGAHLRLVFSPILNSHSGHCPLRARIYGIAQD